MNPLKAEYPQADLADLSRVNIMGEHLLLRMYPEQDETAGGIALTEGSREKRTAAWIIGIGKGIPPMDFSIGDTVMCPTAALMNVLPELDDKRQIRYVLARDVVLHWPAGDTAP